MKKILLYWLPMSILGVANGIIRGLVYSEAAGEPFAHQISAVSLVFLLLVYGLLIRKKLVLKNTQDGIYHGLMWTGLTILFEFVLGYWVFQQPLEVVLENYNIARGQWWPFVLLFIFFLPFILRMINRKNP